MFDAYGHDYSFSIYDYFFTLFGYIRQMKKRNLAFLLTLIGVTAIAQPTIKSADLAVVAYQTDMDDTFAFVALAAIPAGSILFITDEGYDDNGFTFDSTEDVFKWTVTQEIDEGTIVKFTNGSAIKLELDNDSHGQIQHVDGSSDMNLSAGDQLFLYQTDNNVYSGNMQRLDENGAAEPGLIYAFNGDNSGSTNGWKAPGDPHTSASSQAPANMTVLLTSDGSGNASIANANGMLTQAPTSTGPADEYDNYVYDGPTGAASKAEWLTRLHTTTNWNSTDDMPYCILTDSSDDCSGDSYFSQNFAVVEVSVCVNPDIPTLSLSSSTACDGATTVMTITGNLNDATGWNVYTSSCGGTSVGTTPTSTYNLSPSTTTSYYVRGEGGCVTPGSCGSVTLTVTPSENASFTYNAGSYCVDAADPTPTVTGVAGGTFSSTSGLSIVASTGAIDVSASTAGSYTVTYTTSGTLSECANSSTASVTISNSDDASFSYGAAAYCVGDADPSPTVTGLTGGTFSSTAGLSIDASTGSLDVSASTPGTYTVTYTTAGSCPNSSTANVTINGLDNASFSYAASSFCTDATDPSPTITGLAGGTFTSTAGLSIDSSSGTIDASASTPGSYTITYTTGGTCPNSGTVSMTINGSDNAAFSYAVASLCADAPNPSPTVTGLTGGSFTSTAGLSIDVASGSIDLANSTAGVYIITYSTAGTCPNSSTMNFTVEALDDASFSYSSASYVQLDDNPTPTVTGMAGGTFSANSLDLTLNAATGEIDIAGSSMGGYTITYSTAGSCPNSATFDLNLSQDLAELLDFTDGQVFGSSIYLEYEIEQMIDSINTLRADESLAPVTKFDFLQGQAAGTRIFMQFDVQGMVDAINELNAPN